MTAVDFVVGLVGLNAIVLLVAFVALVRNHRVYTYRMTLLSEIHKAARADIDADRPWLWRYQAFDRVSHNAMLFRFWLPCRSFYRDCNPAGKGPLQVVKAA